jgi:hypothetical protein
VTFEGAAPPFGFRFAVFSQRPRAAAPGPGALAHCCPDRQHFRTARSIPPAGAPSIKRAARVSGRPAKRGPAFAGARGAFARASAASEDLGASAANDYYLI